jgi:hypothetical protein
MFILIYIFIFPLLLKWGDSGVARGYMKLRVVEMVGYLQRR